MIALAVGLWPEPDAKFSAEKAAAFVGPLFIWLYAELFTEQKSLSQHDRELASRIYQVMSDNNVRFLQEHNFGASWRNNQVSPIYELADLAHNPMSEFTDRGIQKAFSRLRPKVDEVGNRLAMEGNPIGAGNFISMVPDAERAVDFFSPETDERVRQMNLITTELASEIIKFYRILRNGRGRRRPGHVRGGRGSC